jgi:hypothetical protein
LEPEGAASISAVTSASLENFFIIFVDRIFTTFIERAFTNAFDAIRELPVASCL